MNDRMQSIVPKLILLAATLGLAGCANDLGDLATSAATTGTTAYLVGKRADDNDYAAARRFAESQPVALRRDAARGEGEHVEVLAELLGESDPGAFGVWMQTHYAELYPAGADDEGLVGRIVALR